MSHKPRPPSFAEEPIHLAVLLPMNGSWGIGPRIAGAAALAVERVNAQKTLLLRRVLEYSWADSGCSAKQGLVAMGELQNGVSKIDAVVGPGCSTACEVTSHLSGGQGIPQVSWGPYTAQKHARTHILERTHMHLYVHAAHALVCTHAHALVQTSKCTCMQKPACMHALNHVLVHQQCVCAHTCTRLHTCTLLEVARRRRCLTRISTN